MLRIFLNIVAGLSCVLMMSCSVKMHPDSLAVPPEPDLVVNRDGTFTDNRTLLQWAKDDSTPGPNSCYGGSEKSYWYIKYYMECLNRSRYLGYSDWRVPTYNELESLRTAPGVENGAYIDPQVHERLRKHAYWSSADLALFIHTRGLMIYNLIGPIYTYNRMSLYYVWPVRSVNKGKEDVSSGENR
jgi:hypothetical protein